MSARFTTMVFAFAASYAAMAQEPRAVSALGRLEPEHGIIRLSASSTPEAILGGVVAALHVEEGDEVRKGDLLAVLDTAAVMEARVEEAEVGVVFAENLDEMGEIRIPLGSGIAGAVAQSGEAIRIDDAYSDPRFNQDVDRRTGYRTRSILSLPVKNVSGEVFAVAQLLNRCDGQPFDHDDEQRFAGFVQSLGVILETQVALGASER